MTLTVFGASGSGSIAVEAALTLLGVNYDLIEGATWLSEAAQERVAKVNPMRQIPALAFDSGEIFTESGAILLHLADTHPDAKLAPALDDPKRAQFLRWMFFVSSSIYAHYWAKDDPRRLGIGGAAVQKVETALLDRIAACWGMMDAQITTPGRYLLGDDLSVLDLYVTVVSRFNPRRQRFYQVAPKMAPVVKRIDTDPRLKAFWAERFPFETGWDEGG